MSKKGGPGIPSMDKRREDRIILTVPVDYYRADSAARSIGYRHHGYTVNANETGLMVISQGEVPKDSDLRMKLSFCFPELESMLTLAHVVWVAKREKDGDYLLGMKIVEAEQEAFRKWEEFLDNLVGLNLL